MEWKDDPEFFKDYLKQHPNDKFAWYLLGKEYLTKGEQGKAAYCFTQAGEVYQAFENDEHPNYKRIKQALENGQINADKARRKKRNTRLLGLAAIMLLLILIPSWGGFVHPVDLAEEAESTTGDVHKVDKTGGDAEAELTDFSGYGFTYLDHKKPTVDYGQALNSMLGSREGRYGNDLLLSGLRSKDNKWNLWPSKPELLLTVQTSSKGARSNINYYDKETCQCEPTVDETLYEPYINKWKKEQEEEAVLHSAMLAYEIREGVKPSKAEQLHKPYPNNILSGLTPYMREVFEREMKPTSTNGKESSSAPSDSSSHSSSGSDNKQEGSKAAKALRHPLAEPLTIIVDRENYQLAVLSGRTIVRSFPVGLGGSKTPEGEFSISEKVRNPNGKSDGDFGSRGMTLSDTLYAIHGTNEPDSISKDESLGCIRMKKEDVEELFDMVPLETKVTIGKNLLPPLAPLPPEEGKAEPGQAQEHEPFKLPSQTEERNPKKVYKWL